jgi:hypothetical protein
VALEVAGVVGVVAPLVRAALLLYRMVNAVILACRSSREAKSPRRGSRLARISNYCSIMLNQEACLGV